MVQHISFFCFCFFFVDDYDDDDDDDDDVVVIADIVIAGDNEYRGHIFSATAMLSILASVICVHVCPTSFLSFLSFLFFLSGWVGLRGVLHVLVNGCMDACVHAHKWVVEDQQRSHERECHESLSQSVDQSV